MKEKILAALKTKFQNLGFTEKAFGGVAEYLAATVTEEDKIETAISGVEPLLKSFQGDIDKRVNDAVAKTKAELEKKTEDPKGNPKSKEGNDDEVPQWAKDMQAKLEAYEKKESQSVLTSKLRDTLKQKGVTESYLKRISLSVNSENEIEQLATDIEADFLATKQDMINQGMVAEAPKSNGGIADKAEIDDYLKEKFPEVKS